MSKPEMSKPMVSKCPLHHGPKLPSWETQRSGSPAIHKSRSSFTRHQMTLASASAMALDLGDEVATGLSWNAVDCATMPSGQQLRRMTKSSSMLLPNARMDNSKVSWSVLPLLPCHRNFSTNSAAERMHREGCEA